MDPQEFSNIIDRQIVEKTFQLNDDRIELEAVKEDFIVCRLRAAMYSANGARAIAQNLTEEARSVGQDIHELAAKIWVLEKEIEMLKNVKANLADPEWMDVSLAISKDLEKLMTIG